MKSFPGIHHKLISTILMILLCVLTAAGYTVMKSRHRALVDDLQQEGEHMAAFIAEFSTLGNRQDTASFLEELTKSTGRLPHTAYCTIYNERGEVLAGRQSKNHEKPQGKELQSKGELLIIKKEIMRDSETAGQVEIGLFLAPVKERITREATRLSLLVLLTLAATAFVLTLLLRRSLVRPVILLTKISKRLSQGEFLQTDIAERNDEVGRLGRSFNRMSTNLRLLHEDLENKLVERTWALATTERQLKAEIREREAVEKELHTYKHASESADSRQGLFVNHMSREIRTPLNSILGYIQILQRQHDLSEHNRKLINAIEKSGCRLLDVINNILDIVRIEDGRIELQLQEFDLRSLLRGIGEEFSPRCAEKKLSWRIDAPGDGRDMPLFGDREKLRQVLTKLLCSALDRAEHGGIRLKVDPLDDNRFCFEVADTGPGMSEEMQWLAFQPFHQPAVDETREGTGLELSIAKKYTELMGGTVELRSSPDQGTTVRFTLQFAPPPREKPEPAVSRDQVYRFHTDQPVKALVVDDVEDNRAVLSATLESAEMDVLEAENGYHGVDMAKTHAPDIIFMDQHMPDINGLDAVRIIRSFLSPEETKIVLITADVTEKETDYKREADIDGVIIKPFKLSELFRTISRLLDIQFKGKGYGEDRTEGEG